MLKSISERLHGGYMAVLFGLRRCIRGMVRPTNFVELVSESAGSVRL